jgi:hypothetical protein
MISAPGHCSRTWPTTRPIVAPSFIAGITTLMLNGQRSGCAATSGRSISAIVMALAPITDVIKAVDVFTPPLPPPRIAGRGFCVA